MGRFKALIHRDRLRWILTRTGLLTIALTLAGILAVAGAPAAHLVGGLTVLGTGLLAYTVLSDSSERRKAAARAERSRQGDIAETRGEIRSLRDALTRLDDGLLTVRQVLDSLQARLAEIGEAAQTAEANATGLRELVDERTQALSTAARSTTGEARTDRRALRAELAAERVLVERTAARLDKFIAAARLEIADNPTATEALVREAVRSVRAEIAQLQEWRRTAGPEVTTPVPAIPGGVPTVSIAIPVFNRPHQLTQCLESITTQVQALGTDSIEVWVTDDASNDSTVEVGRSFALEHTYVGFRANPQNLGLEANLMESVRPCTGDYIWLMGSDDIIAPGGLERVLEEAATGEFDMLLFDKQRVDRSLELELPTSLGHAPSEVTSGECKDFDTMLDLAAETGIVSAFGFTSQVLTRRNRFLAVDPDPYIGLMMYPHLGVMLESCGLSPVRYCHTPAILQRTLTVEQKLAESIGRVEESFMAGAEERNSRWFGAAYAALLQRVIDRSEIQATQLIKLPERLFNEPSLIDFIERNWQTAVRLGVRHPVDVLADSRRLFETLGRDPSISGD